MGRKLLLSGKRLTQRLLGPGAVASPYFQEPPLQLYQGRIHLEVACKRACLDEGVPRIQLLGAYGTVLRKLERRDEAVAILKCALEEMEAVRHSSRNSRASMALFKGFRWSHASITNNVSTRL